MHQANLFHQVKMLKRSLSAFVSVIVLVTSFTPTARGAAVADNTKTSVFTPLLLRGLTIDPANALNFNFIVQPGDQQLTDDQMAVESRRLIKYFLAALSMSDEDLWVNLSPFESNRIIDQRFAQTELGRDLLGQDYLLKEMASSMLHPDTQVGGQFWAAMYQKLPQFTEFNEDVFQKIWIVPSQADVYEQANGVFIVDTYLKVQLDNDRLTLDSTTPSTQVSLMRTYLLPEMERVVNTGEEFAQLRQIYHAVILAAWFKRALSNSLLAKGFAERHKTAGLEFDDERAADAIYAEYVQTVRDGVFNFIREEYDPTVDENIPRHYFSGGLELGSTADLVSPAQVAATAASIAEVSDDAVLVKVNVQLIDAAGLSGVRSAEVLEREGAMPEWMSVDGIAQSVAKLHAEESSPAETIQAQSILSTNAYDGSSRVVKAAALIGIIQNSTLFSKSSIWKVNQELLKQANKIVFEDDRSLRRDEDFESKSAGQMLMALGLLAYAGSLGEIDSGFDEQYFGRLRDKTLAELENDHQENSFTRAIAAYSVLLDQQWMGTVLVDEQREEFRQDARRVLAQSPGVTYRVGELLSQLGFAVSPDLEWSSQDLWGDHFERTMEAMEYSFAVRPIQSAEFNRKEKILSWTKGTQLDGVFPSSLRLEFESNLVRISFQQSTFDNDLEQWLTTKTTSILIDSDGMLFISQDVTSSDSGDMDDIPIIQDAEFNNTSEGLFSIRQVDEGLQLFVSPQTLAWIEENAGTAIFGPITFVSAAAVADAARLASESGVRSDQQLGGIDLQPVNNVLNVNTLDAATRVSDQVVQQLISAAGVRPVIVDIVPLSTTLAEMIGFRM